MTMMLAFSSQAAYYIVGSDPFGNWNPGAGVEMQAQSNGTYTYTATISGTIWFVMADGLDASWDVFNPTYRIGPLNGDETITVDQGWITTQKSGGDSGAYKFTGTGSEYKITFNPHIWKFKIEGDQGDTSIKTYTVAGTPASLFGTEWDPQNTDNDMTALGNGKYELRKYGCELGGEVAFKVVGNHDWGNAWPSENYVCPVPESGIYDVVFTFDSITNEPGIELTMSGSIDVRTGDLFILGEVNGNGWDPSVGYPMQTTDEIVFTADIVTNGENIDEEDGNGYSFFSFTTKLGEDSNDWGGIGAFRIGALEDGYLLTEDLFGVPVGMGNFGSTSSFKVPAGSYQLTVNLDEKTMIITKAGGVQPIPGDVNGDGEVNIGDLNAVIALILSNNYTAAGDVNNDGEVNIGDINAIINIILAKPAE